MRPITLAVVFSLAALAAPARVLMTQEQALASAFPSARVVRQKFFLTRSQREEAIHESGVEFTDELIVRYASSTGAYAYFDTHVVRTKPETVMVVVNGDGKIERVDILSFDEPTDYYPKRRWIDQFLGRRLDADLSLNHAIRPISGASLTGRAITNATRKILALHHVLAGVPPR